MRDEQRGDAVHPSALITPPSLAGRFVFLDALRGIAAVAVALFHFNNEWVSPVHREFSALLPGPVLAVWRHLDLGVEIFFVLSGFVIAHSMAGQRVDVRYAANFVARRALRLDPPYWLVLLVTMGWPYLVFPSLVVGFYERFGGTRGMLINMFYLPDLVGAQRIVPVAWTLCLEVQFYLAYLALLLAGHAAGLAWPRARSGLIAAAFVGGGLASMLHWFASGANDFAGRWWMFASGVACYVALRRGWCPWRVGSMALAVLVVGTIRREPLSVTVALTVAAIFLAGTRGALQTWLGWPVLQYLGRTSYSLYLVHMLAGIGTLGVVQRFGDGSPTSTVTAVALALAVSLIAADLLHRFVEGPSARLAHRLRPRRQASAADPRVPALAEVR